MAAEIICRCHFAAPCSFLMTDTDYPVSGLAVENVAFDTFSQPHSCDLRKAHEKCITMVTPLLLFLKKNVLPKRKDPMVKISLDNYATIFGVTPTGIVRYLKLVTPVDREKQMAYTFTVRLPFYLFCFELLDELHVLFCVLKQSSQVLPTTRGACRYKTDLAFTGDRVFLEV